MTECVLLWLLRISPDKGNLKFDKLFRGLLLSFAVKSNGNMGWKPTNELTEPHNY